MLTFTTFIYLVHPIPQKATIFNHKALKNFLFTLNSQVKQN